MPDSLADRLKKLAEQEKKEQHAAQQVEDLQQRVNTFISDNARPEYDKLITLIGTRVHEINPKLGNELPAFQFNAGGQMLQQGNKVAVFYFDKPILNRPENALLVSFGPHPNAQYFMTQPPPAIRYRLQAAASDSLKNIVWIGDLGELTTEQLADFIIENLTAYFLKHKP